MHHDRYLANVRALCDLSLRRLPAMRDRGTGLFIKRVDGQDLRPSGVSVRYSAFAALGLERAEDVGLGSVVDVGSVLAALDVARPHVKDEGDLGLILWAAARRDRGVAERALADLLAFETRSARPGVHRSTQLAWLVLGLTEALARDIGPERDVRARLDAAYDTLMRNRGRSGIMAYARWDRDGLRARLQSTLGFFDAQVYTIAASLRRAAIVGDRRARDVAVTLGRQMLRHQRPLGQWAWHYNADTGQMVELYPVYSVHQDAMAPMAMLALEREEGLQTTPAIAKGVAWLFGENELGAKLVDADRRVIWRSIRRRGPLRSLVYPLKIASFLAPNTDDLGTVLAAPSLLAIDREFRPYHLGLCLYAFADLAVSARAAKPAA